MLVIGFGVSHVACAEFATDKAGRLVLHRFAWEPHAAEATDDRTLTERNRRALAALVARGQWGDACVLAVPAHLALVKFIKIPTVGQTQREQIIRFEAAQSIPYPLEEVCWAGMAMGRDGEEEAFMIGAVKTGAMTALCDAVKAAGLTPKDAIPGALALWRAWRYGYGDNAGGSGALVVDIGARSTQLVFAGMERCFVRTLGLGGNMITQAIATELSLDFIQAEALKRQGLSGNGGLPENSPERMTVARAAAGFTQRLQSELTRALAGHARQAGANQPTQMLLTGGGALLPGLAAALGEKLSLPVKAYDALRGVEVSARARVDGVESAGPQLAILTGLAVEWLAPGARTLNLLPVALRDEAAVRQARLCWIAAMLLLIVAMLPPGWHFRARVRQAKAEAAQIERQLAPLRMLEVRNAQNLARLEMVRREVKALDDLVAAKTAWRDFFADLQNHLCEVEDVWLERLQVVSDEPARHDAQNKKPPPLRLELSGRLLDARNPVSKVSPESYARVKHLLDRIAGSRFVSAVEEERFDTSKPGILRFDFTLVMKPEGSL